MRKHGFIKSWNGTKGFGVIQVKVFERYYLHVTKIRSSNATQDEDKPPVGSLVEFDVSSKPVTEGQLPQALNADITVSDSATAAGQAALTSPVITEQAANQEAK